MLDPVIYKEIVKIQNLVGIAAVTYDNVMTRSARFEKKFSAIPF